MDKKKLTDSLEYVNVWLERSQQIVELTPEVQHMRNILEWEIGAFENRPPEANHLSTDSLDRYGEILYDRITSFLPLLPEIPPNILTQVTTVSSSTASTMVSYVMQIAELDTPDAKKYASKELGEYRKIQESQQRPDKIHALLEECLPGTIPSFEQAHVAYKNYQSGIANKEATAFEMRTFLDKFKGELFERARSYPNENMTFERVIERLFSTAATRPEIEEQFNQRSSLIANLSAVAKRRELPEMTFEVGALWESVLDHVFVISSSLA